jgi:hypothetical protein
VRWAPIGRDRLGILGGPVGAAAALSGTHANHAPGTNDILAALSFKADRNDAVTYTYVYAADSAGVFRIGIRQADGFPFIEIAANRYFGTAIPNPWGRVVDLLVCADRNGSVYFYYDNGIACGSVDISADVATDITSQQAEIGGVCVAGSGRVQHVQAVRFHVVLAANFPTAAQRAAIGAELHQNPDAESPTLAGLTGYAAACRIVLTFIDVDQDGTTVANAGGTGAATFTIGGGLAWRNVRTQAERSMISTPGEDWYCFDATHNAALGATDLGCVAGSYVLELPYKDLATATRAAYLWLINKGANEQVYDYFAGASNQHSMPLVTGGGAVNRTLYINGYSEYARNAINILHQLYDAVNNRYQAFLNGCRVWDSAVVADLDLTGAITVTFDSSINRVGLMALRLWNAASLPADYATIIRRRVVNPWTTTDGFTGMTLRGNWTGRKTAQAPTDTFLENAAQPGVGRLAISGGAQWQNARVLAVKGLY